MPVYPLGYPIISGKQDGGTTLTNVLSSGPVNTVLPSIDNTSPAVGDLLTATSGTWVPPAGGYDYQWYWLDSGPPGTQISGATSNTYTVQASDVGHVLSIRVTPYFSGSPGTPVYSLPTNVVTDTDPIAGFNWAARLQTHIPGSNTPIGLYQDVACTIPCTMDGDSVAAWRDELSTSGVVFTQSDPQKQPLLVFDGSGIPTVIPDGVDDVMVLSNIGNLTNIGTLFLGQQATSATQLSVSFSANGSIQIYAPYASVLYFDWGAGGGSGRISNVFLSTAWNVIECLKNGSNQVVKLNNSPFASGSAGDICPANLSCALFGVSGAFFSGAFTSFLFSNDDQTINETVINTYLTSLNP